MQSITIIGRRWFQKSAGNTYHTVVVLVDGEEVYSSPKAYGYGTAYLDTACNYLSAAHIMPEALKSVSMHCECHGITYHASVSDVGREKDL